MSNQHCWRIKQTSHEKVLKTKSTTIFKDNTCGVDLANMQLISKFDKGFPFLLSVIDIYSK